MFLIKKTLATILVLLLFPVAAISQTPEIDSLETLLGKHKRESVAMVDLLSQLAYEVLPKDREKAVVYARQVIDISQRLDYPKGRAVGLWLTGLSAHHNDTQKQLELFHEALGIAQQIDDKTGMCNYLIAVGATLKRRGDLSASTENYERALGLAQEIDDKKTIIKARINLSQNKNAAGDFVEATQNLQEAIRICGDIHDDQLLAPTYNSLAIIHMHQGNFPAALEYFLSALSVSEKNSNYPQIMTSLINIAGIYNEQKEFEPALETINKALRLATEKADSMFMSACYTNLGNIYSRVGRPEALEYLQKSLSMAKFNPIRQNINNMMSVGLIYQKRKKYSEANKEFEKALSLAVKVGDKREQSAIYATMGSLWFEQKKYVAAKDCGQKALGLAGSVEVQRDCRRLLSSVFASTGDFRNAYDNHVLYKVLSDSMSNEAGTRKIALLESSYKFAKEREVYELENASSALRIKNQRQTILTLVLLSLFVLSLAVAVYWFSRLRKKVLQLKIENMNRELETNQKAMAVAQLRLVQNSERDAQTSKTLEQIRLYTDKAGQQSIGSLINDYRLQSSRSNWDEFETLFSKVNSSFWDKLNAQYSDLTPNERKLCVFLKLNMSNKDIALITFQSEEALKKARLRLRSKLSLDRGANLTTFIQSL